MWIRDVIVNSSVNSFVQDPMLRKVIQSDVVKLCLFVWWLYFTYLHILWLIYRTWEWHSFTLLSYLLSCIIWWWHYFTLLTLLLSCSTWLPPVSLDLLALAPEDAAHDDHDHGERGGDQGEPVGGELLPPVLVRQLLCLHRHLVISDPDRSTILSGKRISSADIRYIHTSSLLDLLA